MKAQNARRPNILLFVFDSLSACEAYANHNSEVIPVLTELQKKSSVFKSAYTTCPESSPARASLFTGLDPSVHGVWTNGVALATHEKTFPQLLTQAGYATWLVGRRQLAGVSNWTTEHSRSDEFTQIDWAHGPLHRSRQNAYLIWLQEKAPQRYAQIFPRQANPDDTTIPSEQYASVATLPDDLSFNHWVGERICNLLSSHQQQQPFLAIAAFSVGSSMGSAPAHGNDGEELSTRALQQADAAIGRVLTQLADSDDETMVIVTAGRGNAVSKDPDTAMHERSIKVPLMFSCTGMAPQTVTEPVSTIDIAPTILKIAGLPRKTRLQGSSLPGVLNENKSPDSWAMCRLRSAKHNWLTTLRSSNMKLIVNHGDTQTGIAATYQLFDIAADPDEQNDLAVDENYAIELENMIDLMIDARCALEDRTEPRIAKF